MNKDQIIEHLRKSMDIYTKDLSREDYWEVLDTIGSDIDMRLEAMEEEDERNKKYE